MYDTGNVRNILLLNDSNTREKRFSVTFTGEKAKISCIIKTVVKHIRI